MSFGSPELIEPKEIPNFCPRAIELTASCYQPQLRVTWDIVDASRKKVSYDQWVKEGMGEQSTPSFEELGLKARLQVIVHYSDRIIWKML